MIVPQPIADLELTLGQGIRSHRRDQGFTQVELAHRANVALSALQALEQGKNSTTATLVKVLRALDQVEWLRRLAPPVPTFSPIELLEQRRRGTRRPSKRTGR